MGGDNNLIKQPLEKIEQQSPTALSESSYDVVRHHSLEIVNQQVRALDKLNEIVQSIQPLSKQELVSRKKIFSSRYKVYPPYEESSGLTIIEIGLKGREERFYQAGFEIKSGSIVSINNNNTLDKAHDGKNMNLSEIHGQLVSKILEDRGDPANAFKPQFLIDESVYEPNTLKTVNLILNVSSTKDLKGLTKPQEFPKGTNEYNQVMLTKLGKHKLYLLGEYFPDYTISHITIDRGKNLYYVQKITFRAKKK